MMGYTSRIKLVHVCVVAIHISGVLCSLKYEKILYAKILNDANYIPDVLPEPKHEEPVKVHLDVRIKKLIKLDVREQVLKVNAFTMLRWTDPQLAWDPSKFDNVRYITVASEKIWTPDIMLYNTADDESNAHTDYYKTKATIYADGDVMWIAPVTWQVSCSFDVTWFPIDKQSCNMTFGSWTYTFHQVELTPWVKHGGDEDHEHFMVKNGEWKVLETKIHYQNISFSCCDEPFSAVVYEVVISRLSLYYFMYILLPLISLAFLFLMVFFIPYDTERMGFGVTILLSITVYLLVISEELPEKSDDKSMLGICFIIEFYLLCAALALSLLTTNLSRRKTQPSGLLMTLHNKLIRKPIIQSEKPEIELEALNPEKATDKKLEEKNFNEQWKNVAVTLDKFFFVLVALLMGTIPIIVTLSLNKSGLGSV